jgi:hypothetical protein
MWDEGKAVGLRMAGGFAVSGVRSVQNEGQKHIWAASCLIKNSVGPWRYRPTTQCAATQSATRRGTKAKPLGHAQLPAALLIGGFRPTCMFGCARRVVACRFKLHTASITLPR